MKQIIRCVALACVMQGLGLSAAEWKSATSGDWTTAANWVGETLPSSAAMTYITNTTGSADYTVTLESETEQQSKGLILSGKATSADKNAKLTYRANLQVNSALSLSSNLVVRYGGRVTIPEGGSLNVATRSASLGALGQMEVTGGSLTTENAFTGFFVGSDAYGNGVVPKLSISSGTVSLKSTIGGDLSNYGLLVLQNYGQFAMTGGKMTLSAPTSSKSACWSQGYANTVNFSLSGDAEVEVTRGVFQLGQGNVVLSDNAKLTASDGSAFRFSPYYSDSNKKINITLSGNSQLRASEFEACEIGKNDARTTGTTVNLTVTGGNHYFHRQNNFGSGSGTYTANLTGGKVTYAGYGLWLGSRPLSIANESANCHLQNTTMMSVSKGAVLYVKAEESQYSSARKHLWGFVIGQGLCGSRSDYMFRGRLEIGPDGVVSNGTAGANLAEPLFVGAGYATGVVAQTGGTYYGAGAENSYTWDSGAMVLGLYGGYGAYEMSGGTAQIVSPAWIGGCDVTNACQRTMASAYLPSGCAGKSVGLLKISGGEMTIVRHVYVGYDGKGTIDLSGSGDLTINRSLVLSNSVAQASTLKFTLTDSAQPHLYVGGSLVVSDQARLVVDASACHAGGVKYCLFESQYDSQIFPSAQVELIDDGRGRLQFSKRGIWYRRPNGLMMTIK